MASMSHTIVAKSDQMNADDLVGGPLTCTITRVDVRESGDQPVSVYVKEWAQPWKPCKTMRRLLIAAWGDDTDIYVGRSIRLFRNPDVKWAGEPTGGIEFSHLSHIPKQFSIALQITKGQKKRFTVDVLVATVTTAEVAAMQKRWLAAVKASGQKATPEGFQQFVYLNTNGNVGAADVTNGAKYTRENLSQCEQAVLEIGRRSSSLDRSELPGVNDAYRSLQQRIRTCQSGADASTIKVDISAALERGEITREESDELAEMLRKEMS